MPDYPCPNCPKSFKRKYSLNVHRDRVHVGVPTHHCDRCGRGFFERRALKRHWLSTGHHGGPVNDGDQQNQQQQQQQQPLPQITSTPIIEKEETINKNSELIHVDDDVDAGVSIKVPDVLRVVDDDRLVQELPEYALEMLPPSTKSRPCFKDNSEMDFDLYFKEFGNNVFEGGGGEEGGRHSTGYDDSNEPNEPNEPNNVSQEVAVIVDDSPDEDIDTLSPPTEAPKEQPVELENSSNINKNSSPAETTNHQSRLSLKASSLSSLASSSSSSSSPSSSSNQNTKVVDGPLPAVPIANDLSITLLSEQGAKRLSQMTGRKYSTITRTIIDYDSKGSIPVVRFEGVE